MPKAEPPRIAQIIAGAFKAHEETELKSVEWVEELTIRQPIAQVWVEHGGITHRVDIMIP
jgi:hypothetical protein